MHKHGPRIEWILIRSVIVSRQEISFDEKEKGESAYPFVGEDKRREKDKKEISEVCETNRTTGVPDGGR
jgi:hypothetical protein